MIIKTMKKVFFDNISGITLFPFIILRKDIVDFYNSNPDFKIYYDILVNHESIHIKQQIEMLVIPFYIWYLIEWCVKAWLYRSWDVGYENISFEREAYENEENLLYLKNRKFYSFLKYL